MSTESIFTAEDLKQFTASEQFYRHGLSRNHIYTEGVQFLAERAQAYWLLDKIALHGSSKIGRERFQVWKLTVNPDCSATLTTEDGNDNVSVSYTHLDVYKRQPPTKRRNSALVELLRP